MRIVLLYPPVWKIPPTGEEPFSPEEGPPEGVDASRALSGDLLSIPGGLLSLAAQALDAGHAVTVLNLITLPWQDVAHAVEQHPAEVYGLSCFTVNRRGTLSLARLIRRYYPSAHIVVGGPHATALPDAMLQHCEAIDTVILGEGELSFAELIRRLERGEAARDIPGTAWREAGNVVFGAPRRRIDDLDRLVPPCRYFNDYIVVSARGCSWNCSFCSSACLWGKTVRSHSARYVVEVLEILVKRHGLTAIAIKDETFTANRSRVLDICAGIKKRKLNFLWSCDTRADCLDEELLFELRSAGCRRISIGVESGSPPILKSLNKKLRLSDVRRATEAAKKFGVQVRFYMIVGSPAETLATLRQSIAFVQRLCPHEVIWNPFTLLPGTRSFAEAVERGTASASQFFTERFFECVPLEQNADDPEKAQILSWLRAHQGVQRFPGADSKTMLAIVRIFPKLHSAHLDLAHAYLREGKLDFAAHSLAQAEKLGYPQPGIIENYRACLAALRGNITAALAHLLAAKQQGYHAVVERNIASAQAWSASRGVVSGRPLELEADNSFEVTRPLKQPLTPGSIRGLPLCNRFVC
ncbi:MAG: B12-binding domain-containing radical SAM protein [Desulfobacterota bacterium]|nr:B12-binding domain-containing radical SAM protein [Thermodesulfobacteriota bacterium]